MTSSFTPGISRIDQPSRRTHGFFVRVSWQGQIFSGFFADKKYGGCEQALATAQKFYLTLRKKLGKPAQRSRRWNAEVVRRKGRSGIQGVQRVINRQVKPWRKYWLALWSPELGVVRRKQFSIRKYGEKKAKNLAIRARQAGVRSMK
jgi:hypothetical protein